MVYSTEINDVGEDSENSPTAYAHWSPDEKEIRINWKSHPEERFNPEDDYLVAIDYYCGQLSVLVYTPGSEAPIANVKLYSNYEEKTHA